MYFIKLLLFVVILVMFVIIPLMYVVKTYFSVITGYCPQFDAIFGELTGRETLYLFSRFRGLREPNSPLRAETLANALGFIKHLDKRVSGVI